MDAADLLAALHPLRPPPATAAGIAAEALAALALGLTLAAAVVLMLRRRHARPDPLAAARALPAPARIAAALAALRDAAPARPGEDWAQALDRRLRGAFSASPALTAARAAVYGGAPAPDPDAVEAAARRLLRRLGRRAGAAQSGGAAGTLR
jgi:hypothetical protein